MRQDTAPQLAILFDGDTGPEPVSRRLAASAGKPDCTSAFPRCAGQLVAKGKVKEASSGQRYIRRVGSRTTGRGKGLWYLRTRMLTPLIDGLGRA